MLEQPPEGVTVIKLALWTGQQAAGTFVRARFGDGDDAFEEWVAPHLPRLEQQPENNGAAVEDTRLARIHQASLADPTT
ncbi:hypothetical protein [Paracoccus seriniphilus]|uniref:hypothetical protein n=1 Tax=Paracoccus seriniphilus TaxID=184748 RepID=UPI003562A5EC